MLSHPQATDRVLAPRRQARAHAHARFATPVPFSAFAALVALLLLLLSSAPSAAAQQTGSGTGRVIDAVDVPASGATVRLVGTTRTDVTDADGAFAFEAVSPGEYVVQVDDERYGSGVERIRIEPGGSVRVEITLSPLFQIDPLVVTAGAVRSEDELFQAAQSLSGRELRRATDVSLGETVANEPGVTASYFGPASSRPIIRGLGGDRVRIMESGIGTGDASNTSPDHAVSIEPQSADRIEIVRGPATLLYGSSAIGGVVNVIDGRVPRERPTAPFSGELRGVGGSVADEGTGAGRVNAAAGDVVFHLSGLYRNTGDYAIPGHAELEEEGEHEEGGEHEEEGEEGVLPNSALENYRFASGVSYVGDDGFLGVSFSGYDSDYGIPGGHGHEEEGGEHEEGEEEEEEEEGGVTIDLQQRRFDLEGERGFTNDFARTLKGRFGLTDYRHFEVEPSGEIGTRFENDFWEGRLELEHALGDRISGSFGAQLSNRDFSAIGEEAFVPPSETDLFALFLFEELSVGDLRIQGGARWETQTSTDETNAFEEDYDGFSVSGGLHWDASEPVSLALSVARSVKLPTAEELFSNGPHLATRAFEIGSRDLEEEVGTSVDATVHVHTGRVRGQLTGYVTDFDDFIFQEFTGEEEDDLPVLLYTQRDAIFTGYEASASFLVLDRGQRELAWEVSSDYVRAELSDSDDPLPRIPPLRLGTGLRYEGDPWFGAFRVQRTTEQDRTAPNESSTDGYTMVDASVGARVLLGGLLHEITLKGTNLADEEARNHVSLLKDVAPLPGRGVRLMYRLVF